ncbi:RluA family pseudouridine synthase [Bacillota bacterium]
MKRRMNISSRLLRKLKFSDLVYLNGRKTKLFEKGKEGDIITLDLPDETSDFLPEDIPVSVIFEDADILVINKQAGIVVHPTKGHQSNTMANALVKYMSDKGDRYKIRFINRLDMNTTGVLLVGKNAYCQEDFARQASSGGVEKKYLTVVKGNVNEDKGTIDLPTGKPSEDDIRRAVYDQGYPSLTHYEVIERFAKGYTLLRVALETGRTHQIRVHLSHIGYPVVGDVLYGQEDTGLIGRQALHAEQLSFNHPVTGKRLSFQAPLPADMKELLLRLR